MFGLISPVIDAINKAPLPITHSTTVSSRIELPRGTTHAGEARVPLLLHDPTLGERVSQGAPGLLLAAMIIAIACLLFQLLRSSSCSCWHSSARRSAGVSSFVKTSRA